MKNIKAPIFAISRLRMGTDGNGVTTLVAFMGCPLRCKYCLNPKCHEPVFEKDGKHLRKGIMMLTPQGLYDMVKIDNIYFQSTGGGVCFGGGEPTLYADFIEAFRKICDPNWKITLETCLRTATETIAQLAPIVNYWIVDVKSVNEGIYEDYTGYKGVHAGVIKDLIGLKNNVPTNKVTIKVPLIPDYNDNSDIEADIRNIKALGFKDVVKIEYVKR